MTEAPTQIEQCLAKLDDIIVSVSTRTLVPSSEVVDDLLDLRQLLGGYWLEPVA